MNLTEGYIYRKGMAPQTRTVISTKNKIFATPYEQKTMLQIGVVSNFEASDSRAVEAVRGIGFGDQIAELVPGVSDPITLSLTRSALYLALIMQALGYKAGVDGLVRALKHHRWPFDIKQEIVFSEISTKEIKSAKGAVSSGESASLKALITYYEACWMTSYNWAFTSDTALVQENCEVSVSDITDGNSNYQTFVSASNDTGNSPFVGAKVGSKRFSAI